MTRIPFLLMPRRDLLNVALRGQFDKHQMFPQRREGCRYRHLQTRPSCPSLLPFLASVRENNSLPHRAELDCNQPPRPFPNPQFQSSSSWARYQCRHHTPHPKLDYLVSIYKRDTSIACNYLPDNVLIRLINARYDLMLP
jgi:hypothetical protein